MQFLDNVLPVIQRLRKDGSDQIVKLVFSSEHILVTAGSMHPLLHIALSIVDEIWFPIGKKWHLVKDGDTVQKFGMIARKSSRISRFAFRYRAEKLIEKAPFMRRSRNLILDFGVLERRSYLLAAKSVKADKILCLTHGEPHVEFMNHAIEERKVSEIACLEILEQLEAPLGSHVFLTVTKNIHLSRDSQISIRRLARPPRLNSEWYVFVENFYQEQPELFDVDALKPFGLFFSRPHVKSRKADLTINPNLATKQKVLDEVKSLLISHGLTPVFIKHPHERVDKLNLKGWVTISNVHNLYLLKHTRAAFSFGTSVCADSLFLGITMIDYRPDVDASWGRKNWTSFSTLVTLPEELNPVLDRVLQESHTVIPREKTFLPVISSEFLE